LAIAPLRYSNSFFIIHLETFQNPILHTNSADEA
jgi:hypothetical protein